MNARIVAPLAILFVSPAGALLAGDASTTSRLTARQVIERIQKETGVTPRPGTVDTIKAGNPDTLVTGIATTFTASWDVLHRAAASGKNLIVAHEPTFYNHLDETKDFEKDPVYLAKRGFIEKHNLVVWRFHDGWHARRPDGIYRGMIHALGWEPFEKSEPHLLVLPEASLDQIATQIRDRLQIHTLRAVGDPEMKISKVAFVPGAAGEQAQVAALERDDVELLVAGEAREWETVEYVRDAVAQHRRKALILMGHVPSEEAGMDECARWLRTFLSDLPVEYMPGGEPFWTPK